MTNLVVDPELFIHGDEDADGPVIHVVMSLTAPDTTELGLAQSVDYATRVFDTIRELGGRPRLVDSAAPVLRDVVEVGAEADAVLFLGGGDVDPALYGYSGPEPKGLYGIDRRADEYCIALFQECAARDMPTLAFCRGSQVFNVAFGGTLIPDIAEWGIHRGPGGTDLMLDEPVTLEPDSHIARILGKTTAIGRNGHHQAVDRVAEPLRATAFAADGIVEGTEHRDATWMLGVQWHPEDPDADPQDRRRLFTELLAQARRFAATSKA